jgi:Fe-S cluster biogenesis protein NfuA
MTMLAEEKQILIKKVESAIDSIRPYLEADGGNVSVEDITDAMVAMVRFHGACSSCSMSAMTLKAGVAEAVRLAVPEIQDVIALSTSELTV